MVCLGEGRHGKSPPSAFESLSLSNPGHLTCQHHTCHWASLSASTCTHQTICTVLQRMYIGSLLLHGLPEMRLHSVVALTPCSFTAFLNGVYTLFLHCTVLLINFPYKLIHTLVRKVFLGRWLLIISSNQLTDVWACRRIRTRMHGRSCKCLSLCLTCLPQTKVYELSARYASGSQLPTSSQALLTSSANIMPVPTLHAQFGPRQILPWTYCCATVTGLRTCWQLHLCPE